MDGIGGLPPQSRDSASGSQRHDGANARNEGKESEVRFEEAGKVKDRPENPVDISGQTDSVTAPETVKEKDLESVPSARQSQDMTELVSATGYDGPKVDGSPDKIEAAQVNIADAARLNPEKLLSAQGEGLTSETVLRLIS